MTETCRYCQDAATFAVDMPADHIHGEIVYACNQGRHLARAVESAWWDEHPEHVKIRRIDID